MRLDTSGTFVNSYAYNATLDGKPIGLRDCIVAVAVKIEFPLKGQTGAGILMRCLEMPEGVTTEGVAFVKEPGRCCSIWDMTDGNLNRRASYPMQQPRNYNEDPFDTSKVSANGDRLVFFINGEAVAEKEHRVTEGYCIAAIIAFGKSTFHIDNLELWL
jgi:hypothetical protein